MAIAYRRMDARLRPGVEAILGQFLREDEHYLASREVYGDADGRGSGRALGIFLERPELGFVWVGTGDAMDVTPLLVRCMTTSVPVLTVGPTGSELVLGAGYTCFLQHDGSELACCGDNYRWQIQPNHPGNYLSPHVVEDLPAGVGLVHAAAHDFHTCIALQDGRVYCLGGTGYGKLGHPDLGGRVYPAIVTDF